MSAMSPELLARLLAISAPPDAIHWWPPAAGWWGLAVLALLGGGWAFWLARRRLRRRYRRLAAARLAALCGDWRRHGDDMRLLLQINLLVRQVAAHCHGRAATAISGAPWVRFLAAQWQEPQPEVADALGQGCYRPGLQTDMGAVAAWVGGWIRNHSEVGAAASLDAAGAASLGAADAADDAAVDGRRQRWTIAGMRAAARQCGRCGGAGRDGIAERCATCGRGGLSGRGGLGIAGRGGRGGRWQCRTIRQCRTMRMRGAARQCRAMRQRRAGRRSGTPGGAMFSWQWPWVLVLAPLPWLCWRLLPPRRAAVAVRMPLYGALNELGGGVRGGGWPLALLLWALLLAAAAGPTWVGEPLQTMQPGRDLLLAVDISASMEERDMQGQNARLSRLAVARSVVGDFVGRREGDRLGLILFGTRAYLQTPLTFDRTTVAQHLAEARAGFAGDSTAIGDALGIALKRLAAHSQSLEQGALEEPVIILLTDGQNTAGGDPRAAIDVAAAQGVRVYTVGLGAEHLVRGGIFGFGARRISNRALDEALLQDLASGTGGQYFRARDPQDLERIYRQLDELEPRPDQTFYRPSVNLFHYPLGALAALVVALAALSSLAPAVRRD